MIVGGEIQVLERLDAHSAQRFVTPGDRTVHQLPVSDLEPDVVHGAELFPDPGVQRGFRLSQTARRLGGGRQGESDLVGDGGIVHRSLKDGRIGQVPVSAGHEFRDGLEGCGVSHHQPVDTFGQEQIVQCVVRVVHPLDALKQCSPLQFQFFRFLFQLFFIGLPVRFLVITDFKNDLFAQQFVPILALPVG